MQERRLVTIFGGTGFVGRYVARALSRRNWHIRIASRHPERAFYLQTMGRVGQIGAVKADICAYDSVLQALEGADATVNLVGIMNQTGRYDFDSVHHLAVRHLAQAAKIKGVACVHVSALGARRDSPSLYAISKAQGEESLHNILPESIIFRPSVIFGAEDDFVNRFASLARFLPILPCLGPKEMRLQPVFAGDVAEAIALSLDRHTQRGSIYELGGPEIKTFEEILTLICTTIHRHRWILPLPYALAYSLGGVLEILDKLSVGLFPRSLLFTRDQVRLLQHDNVVSSAKSLEGKTLPGLGITPRSMEIEIPAYLSRFRKQGQFHVHP